MISIIVATDPNGVIGKDGIIPWHLPDDLKLFKQRTLGKSVIMGRKTWDSLPKKPLPERINFVISRHVRRCVSQGAYWYNSLDAALRETKECDDIFIIGGEQIYKLALESDVVDQIIVSRLHQKYEGNCYFNIPENWVESHKEFHNGFDVIYFVKNQTGKNKMTKIENVITEEVMVDPKPTGIKSKVGSDEFVKEFGAFIKTGPMWRSSKKIAEVLNCDPIELSTWMDHQKELVRRPGKEEGIIYYALAERVESPVKIEKLPPGMERKQITEEDRYSVAMLHQVYNNLVIVLEKYGMHVYNRNKESLAKLVEGREAVSAGISLLVNTLQFDITKLPKYG